eukprot:4104910-Ditylum_brightwellii.AAC.1
MNNMLCKECVAQNSAETKESLRVIMPIMYHDRIEKLLDAYKPGGCASDVKICCEDGHEYNCDAKCRPVKGKKGKD